MKIDDLDNKSLDGLGFEIRMCYFMYVLHNNHCENAGSFFPAATREGDKMVLCFSREELKRIWELMPRVKLKVGKLRFLVNLKTRHAIQIEKRITPRIDHVDSSEFFIASGSYLEDSVKKENFFYWKGLINKFDESFSDFPEEKDDE